MGPVYRGERRVRLRALRALPARSRARWTRRRAPLFAHWSPEIEAAAARGTTATCGPADLTAAIAAFNLAESIRRFGHLAARLDPLGVTDPVGDPSLHPAVARPDHRHAGAAAGVDRRRAAPPSGAANALEAIERLRAIYCATTGHDYNHVFVPDERVWLRQAVETRPVPAAARSDQRARAARSHHAGRDVRALPAPHVPGQDALLDRGSRHDDPDPRRDHQRRRGRRRRST